WGQYRDITVQNGASAKQIWLTEFAYCSNPTPPPGYEYCRYITEDQQAQFLQQAFQMARNTSYIGAMFRNIAPMYEVLRAIWKACCRNWACWSSVMYLQYS